ncbi:WD40 repeat domain-containing serine/threonine-protein kinase [Actinocorallia longicatena]|uniref:Protein kinase domain-containing protein n=1 Tax=Actinocorallia longicatena TaxID=111803 RepID=A0ABP6Q754_9ACTN
MVAEALVAGDPQEIGGYWLAGRLGAGGQGVVYEAYGADGVRVAVKALHGEYAGKGLSREAAAVGQVASFCTARVIEVEAEGARPYIVSEFVPGPDLAAAVDAGGPLEEGDLLRLAIGIATALVAIHRAGVVHRDLKPANVLLGPDGPRVIDFGIARTEDMSRTAAGVLRGTPRYMAPEAFQGAAAGPEVDVWAWGAVVYFAALGRPPFTGASLAVIAHSALHDRPDLDGLPPSLRPAVTAALAKDPAERPTAHRLLLDLVGGDGAADDLLAAGASAAGEVRPPDETVAEPSLDELAERVYQGLDTDARTAAPRVLLRMVIPGETAEGTLRGAGRAEFSDGRTGEDAIDAVIGAFTDAGLLTSAGGRVEIVTAALLRAWPRLRFWIDGERAGLAVHRSLTDAALLWDRHGRKPGDLYQGTPLELAREWAATGRDHLVLNVAERDFLSAAAALAGFRSRRRAVLGAVLAMLLVVALGAVAVAVDRGRTVAAQRDEAVARRLAVLAAGLRRSDPRTGMRLAVAAASLADLPETRAELLAQAYQWEADVFAPPGVVRSGIISALSDDGLVFVISEPGRVRAWDVGARAPLAELDTGEAAAVPVSVSADGGLVALGSLTDGTPSRLWDVRTGSVRTLGFSSGDRRTGLSPRGGYLLALVAGSHQIWNTRTGALVHRGSGLAGWAFAPDDSRVALSLDGGVEFRGLADGRKLPAPWRSEPVESEPGSMTFSADGRWFALTHERRARILDLTTGTWRPDIEVTGAGWPSVRLSSDGRFAALDRVLWEAGGERPLLRYPPGNPRCAQVRFIPGDRGLRCVNQDHAVVSLDVGTLTGRPSAEEPVEDVSLSRDGTVTATRSGTDVRVWEAGEEAGTGVLASPGFAPVGLAGSHSLKLSPDGTLLAVTAAGKKIEIWDRRNRTLVWSFPYELSGGKVSDLAFSPDAAALAVVTRGPDGGGGLELWDLRGRTLLRTIDVPAAPADSQGDLLGISARHAVFRPDGAAVAAGGIGLVAFPSGEPLLAGHDLRHILALSPDGASAVTGKQNDVLLWDARTGRLRGLPLRGHGAEITAAAFSADGSLLATGDRDGAVRLWDTATGRPHGGALPGHSSTVLALAFDGASLLSGSATSARRTHNLDTGRLLRAVCARSGDLTRTEWKTHIPELTPRSTCRPPG